MDENEKLSDFLKQAYMLNKVKDVKDAFEKYPVEEEWHKGKIENIINDPKEIYTIYNVGDIVYVKKYCYSNGELGTNHLFVIVDQDNIAVPIENFGMLISSKIEKTKFKQNKILNKNKENGLKTDSIVKTDEIYKIRNTQIEFKIGQVDKETIYEYKMAFYEINNKK